MDDVVRVEVIDRIEHLTDRLGSILLGELALLANAVEQFSTRRQLGHNVVLVLEVVSLEILVSAVPSMCVPLTRTSRGT